MRIYIYIYIYIAREREREMRMWPLSRALSKGLVKLFNSSSVPLGPSLGLVERFSTLDLSSKFWTELEEDEEEEGEDDDDDDTGPDEWLWGSSDDRVLVTRW